MNDGRRPIDQPPIDYRKASNRPFGDLLGIGLVLGLIGPLIGAFLFYLLQYGNLFSDVSALPFSIFLERAKHPQVLPRLLSFGAIFNLFFFFIGIWTKRYFMARGVLFGTVICGIIMLLMLFVF